MRPVKKPPMPERFWKRVSMIGWGGCWTWTGARTRAGYGVFMHNRYTVEYAHRVSYRMNRHPILDGQVVCHTCDNPACVRPDHLFAGTQRDNMRDCARKTRTSARGRPGIPLETRNEIRRLRAAGLGNKVIAKRLGLDAGAVYGIMSGRTYKLDALSQKATA